MNDQAANSIRRYSENIVIACALKKEAKALEAKLRGGQEVVTTGLGTDRTLRRLERFFEKQKPSLLIFTGMAGQLAPDLQLGEFVFPESWTFESGTAFSIDPTLAGLLRDRGWGISGIGITVRRPVVKQKARLDLNRRTGALICDMESAAALMVSQAYGVPCIAPKIISDTAESGMLAFYRHFSENVEALGREIDRLVSTFTGEDTTGPR
ncbi:MAG: hypothetical protein JSU96_09860 [Acidobacteriota bacterium]|nr:MAG: hypothetical protein JSU96_09860 [Acidobacteriota bacterium]